MPARISAFPTRRRSAGFTLVELLVVVFLILVIATLVVAFAPRLAERQKVPRGASQLQGWLLIAKQRAKRDQLPTGVRLQPDPNNPNTYRELQYIQKPDDWTGGQVQVNAGTLNVVNLVPGTGADFIGGGAFTDPTLYPVQIGDYIEIKGGGLVRRIAVPPAQTSLTLAPTSAYPYPIQPTSDYRIIRSPRPLVGEANLDMPKDIAIQGNTSPDNPVNTALLFGSVPRHDTAMFVDILFSPAGPLLKTDAAYAVPGVGGEAVILWVRDVSLDSPTDGEPLLLTIYAKTGLIAVHPVSPLPDYFTAVKDGRSSGL
jgi:prepilin-type N-terminal cleavage/methylation domain-containing protein